MRGMRTVGVAQRADGRTVRGLSMAPSQSIVLLPGLDGTGMLFSRLEEQLRPAMDVSVVRYPPDPALGYAGYVDIVKEAVGEREIVLLGESFSGPVALMTAAKLGKQVKAVVLAATFVRSPWPAALVRIAGRGDPRMLPADVRDWVLMGQRRDADLSKLLDEIIETRLPRAVRLSRLRAISSVDVRPELAALTCPVLALHGRDDWLVPVRGMGRAISHKGGAKFVVMPGAHMLLQTCALEAGKVIADFAASIEVH